MHHLVMRIGVGVFLSEEVEILLGAFNVVRTERERTILDLGGIAPILAVHNGFHAFLDEIKLEIRVGSFLHKDLRRIVRIRICVLVALLGGLYELLHQFGIVGNRLVIHQDGSIETYKLEEYNIDRLNSGKMLFRIYEQTKDEKYKKALDLLRSQLDTHPRNADGGFWHKKIYENQMWLDGLYMGQPFYAEYAYRNNRVNDYADIINQFVTVARHNYDPKTDLYRHACDVSKREKWADKTTGWSQHCWGRAMGWYAMACVDVLDFIPEHEAGRESVIEILNKLAAQIKRTQDPATGVWYQVIDRSGDEGNYLESSCSTMFVYTLLKALRKGYICPSYMEVAKKGYEGLLTQFIEVDDKGVVSITKGCAVAGLGGKPVYRTGDYNYYITEKIRSNDAKAVGPFIMASLEWERLFQKNSCGTACE